MRPIRTTKRAGRQGGRGRSRMTPRAETPGPRRAGWASGALLGLLALAALPGHAHPSLPAVEPDARPAVIVWWFDVDGLFEDGFSKVSHRTTQIFREIGVEVSVRTGEVLRRAPGEGPRQIVGVLMRQPVLAWELKPEVMGTVIRPGPDTLYVFLPRILETLGKNT